MKQRKLGSSYRICIVFFKVMGMKFEEELTKRGFVKVNSEKYKTTSVKYFMPELNDYVEYWFEIEVEMGGKYVGRFLKVEYEYKGVKEKFSVNLRKCNYSDVRYWRFYIKEIDNAMKEIKEGDLSRVRAVANSVLEWKKGVDRDKIIEELYGKDVEVRISTYSTYNRGKEVILDFRINGNRFNLSMCFNDIGEEESLDNFVITNPKTKEIVKEINLIRKLFSEIIKEKVVKENL